MSNEEGTMKVYLSLLRDGGRERDGMTPFPTMRSDGSHTTSPSFGLYDDEMTYGQVDEASHTLASVGDVIRAARLRESMGGSSSLVRAMSGGPYVPMTGSVLSGSGQNSHLAASGMSRWAAPSPAATLILGHQLLLLQQKQQREQDLLRLAASSGSGPRQSLNPNLSLPGISSSMLPGESRRLCGGLTGNRGLSGVNGPNSGSVSTLLQSLRATVATESTVSSPPFHPNSFVRQEFNDDVRLLEQQPLPTPLLPLQMPRVVFPVILAAPSDGNVLSDHQSYLRQQIQVFQATNEDVNTPVRGRNKRIYMGQVGIRCRHCAHLPVEMRQLGSVYFPLSMMGFYQAAQNMCSTHIQCGKCSELSDEVKDEFIRLLALKTLTSTGGRRYWAEQLRQMGLVDTDKGVFSVREVPRDVQVIPMGSGMSSVSGKRKAVAAGKPRSMGVKAAPGRAKAPKSHTA